MTKYIIILFGLFLATSCESERAKILRKLNKKTVELNEEYKGKALTFPFRRNQMEQIHKFTIVVYYDAECTVCFEQLKEWKELIKVFSDANSDLNFKFILHSTDEQITKNHLKILQFPVHYVTIDKRNDFLSVYNFVSDRAFNSFLIDSDDKILFVGSPMVSSKIKEIYLSILHAQ